ncbi:hypothetical protein LCGC14_2677470, partial [marine sediment metagenome]
YFSCPSQTGVWTASIVASFNAGNDNLKLGTAAGGNILMQSNKTTIGSTSVVADGTLHVHTATAGAWGPDANADDLMVENSADGGISIAVPDINAAYLMFSSPSRTGDYAAYVSGGYNGGTDQLQMGTNGFAPTLFIQSGDVGIGLAPSYKLDLVDDLNGYVARFHNDGNNLNRKGIKITGGADDGSDATTYIILEDGNGDEVGGLEHDTGTVQLFQTSDISLKSKVKNVSFSGINIIKQLKVREFEYKKRPGVKVDGLIAQEVEKIYPRATGVMGDEETKKISHTALIMPLLKGMQEQQAMIEELKIELIALKNK